MKLAAVPLLAAGFIVWLGLMLPPAVDGRKLFLERLHKYATWHNQQRMNDTHCAIVFEHGRAGFFSSVMGLHATYMLAQLRGCLLFTNQLVGRVPNDVFEPSHINTTVPAWVDAHTSVEEVPFSAHHQKICSMVYEALGNAQVVRLYTDKYLDVFTKVCEQARKAIEAAGPSYSSLLDECQEDEEYWCALRVFQALVRPAGVLKAMILQAQHNAKLLKAQYGSFVAFFLRAGGVHVLHFGTDIKLTTFNDGYSDGVLLQWVLDNIHHCTSTDHIVAAPTDSALYRTLLQRNTNLNFWSCCSQPAHVSRVGPKLKVWRLAQVFYDIELASHASSIVYLQGKFWHFSQHWHADRDLPATKLSVDMGPDRMCELLYGKTSN